ncbi:hypothetical protein EYF80_040606 [Liparis tanakae]|uniref:Uncharacterized protein n=1 Tax=Liparis tanakae TaxID=230148 RepID=A0A4Z2G6J6_9TELE|nr:hypothetical protein EYF80_040606 [Liparis tanakae]
MSWTLGPFDWSNAPSRCARILSLWGAARQRPMASSASRTRLRKRSRSRTISSQSPLRDAWRAKGQVRITWTWTTGENRTWNPRRDENIQNTLIT